MYIYFRSSDGVNKAPPYFVRTRYTYEVLHVGVVYNTSAPTGQTDLAQEVKGKIWCGQAVKAIFRRSKILTPVAALDTAPMGMTPPCLDTALLSRT